MSDFFFKPIYNLLHFSILLLINVFHSIDRMLAENRACVALEKEKIRKDYEKMSSQLSEILNNNELANSFVQVSIFQFTPMKK